MTIKTTEFIGSFEYIDQTPSNDVPEFAFIGRSNVGKSSLINMLVGRKDLAHTSSTPGKTQTMNYFLVNDSWYIVDLPGYGYAKSSKTNRAKWKKMIENYLLKKSSLYCVFVLIDSRIPLQKIDNEFLNWLGTNRIPFVICYTKVDKIKKDMEPIHLETIRSELLQSWEYLPEEFITSVTDKKGKEEILNFIYRINNN